jgi:hypothetical protein
MFPQRTAMAEPVRLLIRIAAVLTGLNVLGTLWFVAAFAAAVGFGPLVAASPLLGWMTIVGWVISVLVGPVAAVQLWRFRGSGRRAGIIVFGYGFAYYVVALLVPRPPEASVWQAQVAAITMAMPLVVLLAPQARALFSAANAKAAGSPPVLR